MKLDKSGSQSYKDLVRENMKLNSELRKLGSLQEVSQGESLRKKPEKRSEQKQKNSNYHIDDLDHMKIKMSLDKLKQTRTQKSSVLNQRKYSEHSQEQSKEKLLLRKKLNGQMESPVLRNSSDLERPIKIQNIQRASNNVMGDINSKYGGDLKSMNEKYEPYYSKKINYQVFTPPDFKSEHWYKGLNKTQEGLLSWIRENIVGFNTTYTSQIQLDLETIYVDHTATNRPFRTVEIMIEYSKLFSANPHTEFSRFGKYSTEMMHYAHQSLLRSFSASSKQYVILPTGSGCTGAVERCVRILKNLENQGIWGKPTVFLTPYEHHSNILPWVEFYDKVELLSYEESGTLNIDKIYDQIVNYPKENIIISISATSNVTSKKTKLKDVNNVIKKIRKESQKKIVFGVDCAAFCCHEELNLAIYDQIDFAFISPHKNLGGAETCGILAARKSLIDGAKPTFPGGGTVRFVSGYNKEDVMYSEDVFQREIAGTPNFFGFYRAALSFQLLKNAIGYDFIKQRERENTELFFNMIEKANEEMVAEGKKMIIQLYGERNLDNRANVITFNFEYDKLKFIQHSFASILFTDIFGIQVRSGCFCAGPYGIELLSISKDMIDEIQDEVEAGIMINKPGYLRLDLTFYLEKYEIQYIAKSTILIAKYWQNLEKLYTVCKDGEILLLPCIAKKHEEEIYSLGKFAEAFDKIKLQTVNNKEKLQNRKKTLENQLRIAQFISKNPMDFIRKVKAGKVKEI